MDIVSLSSTPYPHPPPFPSPILTAKPHHFPSPSPSSSTTFLSFSHKSSLESDNSTTSSPLSGPLRRPKTIKTSPTPTPTTKSNPKNPLRNLVNPTNIPTTHSSDPLSNKFWLSSKLSPPPPPPPQLQETIEENGIRDLGSSSSDDSPPQIEFRQEGKIFVGNLPLWIKKNEVAEFFRQFGPIKNVVLIKGHDDTERNAGFGFVIYGGPTAERSATKAVEFDGVEFRGRILTVKLDDGRRLKARSEERARWVVEGGDGVDYRSKWHEERESCRKEFKKVLETEPENWQAVVSAFERIKKV